MSKDELIALARKLYGEGMSYGKIADKFNVDGVPTSSGKGSWEKKMVSRLIAADTLKKAEVKTGLKSDREAQLESEVESLKLKLRNIESYRDELFSENNRLESENAGLRADRDELLKELNRVKQHLSERTNQINTVYAVNAKLTLKSDRLISGIKRLYSRKSQSVNGFRAETERLRNELNTVKQYRDDTVQKHSVIVSRAEHLQRQLAESELKYKTLYESEITRLGSELAIANQKIQELQDRQTFLKPESESGIPKNFMGWTLGKRSDGRGYNIYRKIGGKLSGLYIGKEWNESDARNKIAAFESKQKPQSELFAGSDGT